MKQIAINGTFLSEKRTGIYRFAEEIIKALDCEIESNKAVLIVPQKAKIPFKLHSIQIKQIGPARGPFSKGFAWEQIFFAIYALFHHLIPLNLCNVTPLLAPRGLA